MRQEDPGRSVPRCNRGQSLQIWLKRLFTGVAKRLHHKKENKELLGLSEQLLEDLGFSSNGEPLHWSSYSPEQAESDCLKFIGKDQTICEQSLTKPHKIACHCNR